MKIDKITWESRNDFAAVMECEHCGHKEDNTSGYHDNNYHTRVIPAMHCGGCGKDREGNLKPKPLKKNTVFKMGDMFYRVVATFGDIVNTKVVKSYNLRAKMNAPIEQFKSSELTGVEIIKP